MEFILAVGLAVLFVMVLRLSARVEKMDAQYKGEPTALSHTKTSPVPMFQATSETAALLPVASQLDSDLNIPQPVTSFIPSAVPATRPPVLMYTEAPYQAAATEFFLYTWFKEQALIKIGALIFFFGAVWFVSYAISEDWISPLTQIWCGLAVTCALYGIGVWRKTFELTQYIVLTALGTGVAIATIYAGQVLFEVFSPLFALALLVASITYTVFVSFKTKTQWLAVAAVLAGFAAPFMIGDTTADPTLFMCYLLALSTGFLTVVFLTHWRIVTLVLVVGVSVFQTSFVGLMPNSHLWYFALAFAALFLASTTISLLRSKVPQGTDIGTLLIVGLIYNVLAGAVSQSASLALFAAALVIAVIGYVVYVQQGASRIVAVFACFASAALMLGTTHLFSGDPETLTIALTVEVVSAFIALTYLNLGIRAIYLGAIVYSLPLCASFSVLFSAAWQSGVWHTGMLSVVILATALLGSTVWLIERPACRSSVWGMRLAPIFGGVGFVYTMFVLLQIGKASFPTDGTSGMVFAYILLAVFGAICTYYIVRTPLSFTWAIVTVGSVILPVLLSFRSLTSSVWNDGVLHADAIGVYSILAVLLWLLVLIADTYKQTNDRQYRTLAIVLLVCSVTYSFLLLAVFWPALLGVSTVGASVLIYVSYALVLYALTTILWQIRTPLPLVYYSTAALAIPLMLSLPSLAVDVWDNRVFQPHAAGVYVMTALLLLMAMRTSRYRTLVGTQPEGVVTTAKILFIGSGLYATALVWLMAHSSGVPTDIAISIALFVYTVVGLGLYVYGSSLTNKGIKYAGMALLVLVVLRLGLIDVWKLAIFWRIITFLGIGLLFMIAALFEKKKPPVE